MNLHTHTLCGVSKDMLKIINLQVNVTLFSKTTLQLRSLVSRLWSASPFLTHSINSRAAFTPVPPIGDSNILSNAQLRSNYLESPADFFKAIGRSCETKISVESWDEFWKKDGPSLKKDGVPVRDWKYAFCKILN